MKENEKGESTTSRSVGCSKRRVVCVLCALSSAYVPNDVSSGFQWTRCRLYALDDLSFGRVIKRRVVREKQTRGRSV